MYKDYSSPEPTQTCPYCGNQDCYADFVDNGVGLVQCAPFYCQKCGACEIGSYDKVVELTERERKFNWYEAGRAHLTSAPTVSGIPVDQDTAKFMYRIGMLDKKDNDK